MSFTSVSPASIRVPPTIPDWERRRYHGGQNSRLAPSQKVILPLRVNGVNRECVAADCRCRSEVIWLDTGQARDSVGELVSAPFPPALIPATSPAP